MQTQTISELRRRPFRRLGGGYVLLVTLALVVGSMLTFGLAWAQPGIQKFTVVHRIPVQRTLGPLTMLLQGLPPESSIDHPLPASSVIQSVDVFGNNIVMLAGGKVVRDIATPRPVTTLAGVVAAVDDPSWISSSNGTVIFNVGFVVNTGAHITIAAPLTKHIVMVDQSSNLLGSEYGGQLTFDGVSVTSTAPPHVSTLSFRPAIVATHGGILDIENSRFSNLGWDGNASYGVAWVQGAIGRAVSSTFQDGFIGAYTSTVHGIQFIHDIFKGNELYGLDPHTHSYDLLVDGVLAEHNRAHGIIFSQYVTNSIVENSVSRYNGENGIMMDLYSTGNIIRNNQAYDNHGDGIVTTTSPHTVITRNSMSGNRIGIRVSPKGGVQATHNKLFGNQEIEQGIVLNSTNHEWSNGGQFREHVLIAIWIAVPTVTLLLALIILLGYALSRRHDRYIQLQRTAAA